MVLFAMKSFIFTKEKLPRKSVLGARRLYFNASSAISSLYFRWPRLCISTWKLKENLRVRDT